MGLFDSINPLGILGGLLGASGSGDKTQTQTQEKTPWGPAQQYILQGLQDTANLNKAYQQNPFSALQQQQYGNQFGDIANFRNNVMPGLMQFANAGMSGGYQRGGSTIPRASLNAGGVPFAPFGVYNSVPGMAAPTSALPADTFAPKVTAPVQTDKPAQAVNALPAGLLAAPLGGSGGRGGDSSFGEASPDDGQGGLSGLSVGAAGLAQDVMGFSPLAGLALGGISDLARWGNDLGYRSPSESDSEASTSAHEGSSESEGQAGGSGGFYKGGEVKKKDLSGPDPKGPDQGKANLQSGEYVVKKDAVDKYGKGLLADINAKRFNPKNMRKG